MKNGNTALYIGADPFTFNDLDLVRKSVKTFGFVNIFLDRKNRDAEYKEYLLNYSDRSDIIIHDMKDAGIDQYRIIPIDETVEKAMTENEIQTLILNFDYQQSIDFRMMKVLQYVNPNLPIMLMRGEGYIEPKFIKTLLDSDSSMTIYRKFCSDYAYTKLKIKTMFKVGLTGTIGPTLEKCENVFAEHGYMVIDVDKFIQNIHNDETSCDEVRRMFKNNGWKIGKVSKQSILDFCLKNPQADRVFQQFLSRRITNMLGREMQSRFADALLVKFGMLCEFGIDGMMDRTICVKQDAKSALDGLLTAGYAPEYASGLMSVQMPIDEKADLCDYVVDASNGADPVGGCIKLVNGRLKH